MVARPYTPPPNPNPRDSSPASFVLAYKKKTAKAPTPARAPLRCMGEAALVNCSGGGEPPVGVGVPEETATEPEGTGALEGAGVG